ncbi:YppG family protein [Bacillus infantis]|nr:YppG family protein [Bacillus infantis]
MFQKNRRFPARVQQPGGSGINGRHRYYSAFPTMQGSPQAQYQPQYQPFAGSQSAYFNPFQQAHNPPPYFQGYQHQMQPPIQPQVQPQAQQPVSQGLFQNPLQQEEAYQQPQSQQPSNPYPFMNPYPKQSFMAKQPSGVQSIMNSFKGQDGSLDFNKMMNTAGQMMSAVNQVSSMVKGLGGIFKV